MAKGGKKTKKTGMGQKTLNSKLNASVGSMKSTPRNVVVENVLRTQGPSGA